MTGNAMASGVNGQAKLSDKETSVLSDHLSTAVYFDEPFALSKELTKKLKKLDSSAMLALLKKYSADHTAAELNFLFNYVSKDLKNNSDFMLAAAEYTDVVAWYGGKDLNNTEFMIALVTSYPEFIAYVGKQRADYDAILQAAIKADPQAIPAANSNINTPLNKNRLATSGYMQTFAQSHPKRSKRLGGLLMVISIVGVFALGSVAALLVPWAGLPALTGIGIMASCLACAALFAKVFSLGNFLRGSAKASSALNEANAEDASRAAENSAEVGVASSTIEPANDTQAASSAAEVGVTPAAGNGAGGSQSPTPPFSSLHSIFSPRPSSSDSAGVIMDPMEGSPLLSKRDGSDGETRSFSR